MSTQLPWWLKLIVPALLGVPVGMWVEDGIAAVPPTVSIAAPALLAQVGTTPTADALVQQGLRLYRAGNGASLQQAIEVWQQAAQAYAEAGNVAGQAITLVSIGRIHADLGNGQNALAYYNRALPLLQATGERSWEGTTLNNMGSVYQDLGQYEQALMAYQAALVIRQAGQDRVGTGATLSNIGAVYDNRGQYEQALAYYTDALAIFQAVQDRPGEGRTLNNIGATYIHLSQYEQALSHYQEALAILQQVQDRSGEGTTLNNMGVVYANLGQYEQALVYYQEALAIRQDMQNRPGEGQTLNNIGAVYANLGQYELALTYYTDALIIRQAVQDRIGVGATLNNIGFVYANLGQYEPALTYYTDALTVRQAVQDRSGEAVTFWNIAYLYRDQGNLDLALTNINAAIAVVEDLRGDFTNTDLQTTYFSSVQGYYQFKIDLLMQLGDAEAAFNTSEAARARTLLALLNEAQVNIRAGVAPTLLAEEQALQQNLANIESRRVALLERDYTQADLDTLDAESDAALQQLEQKLAQIRTVSPAYAELQDPQPLDLGDIRQQVLDADTVLLQYALGEAQSYLWIVGAGADEFAVYTLPGEAALEETVGSAKRDLIRINRAGLSAPSIQTAGWAIQSAILPELPAWATEQRLLIAADGILHELPFAALPIPNRSDYTPLLLEYELLTQPSASAIAILRQALGHRPPAPKTLAILADPIYTADDDRLSDPAPTTANDTPVLIASTLRSFNLDSIQRLDHTRAEAQRILALLPEEDDQINPVFGLDANYDWLTTTDLDQYRFVHLATHGFVNAEVPELSGLVLALVNPNGTTRDDGFLRLHDIFNLRLNAELVVLSACQTGLGRDVGGEGLVGLARGFMYAGAERLLVSLWNVDDATTAELMEGVYRAMLDEGLTPAAALQATQRAMAEAGLPPFFWAAFTPQGEWR